jgi:hypothetical protein
MDNELIGIMIGTRPNYFFIHIVNPFIVEFITFNIIEKIRGYFKFV